MTNWYIDWKAWKLAKDYNLAPHENLKSEHVEPTAGIGSFFFCNTSNDVKILVQYDQSELVAPPS